MSEKIRQQESSDDDNDDGWMAGWQKRRGQVSQVCVNIEKLLYKTDVHQDKKQWRESLVERINVKYDKML